MGFDVFVDYAHTDDALQNVLRAVRPLTRGRLWCVFGCGGDRDRSKRPLMARAVAQGVDAFIITSDNPRTEDPHAIIADIERGLTGADRDRAMIECDRAAAITRAIDLLAPGDLLVIAGKGHEAYQVVGNKKLPFDDAAVAREAIELRMASRERDRATQRGDEA
jgi:UDP-N-acetylmuramoyl-L-alanyl-D-glutamate--2,6-diaminopimelate ligase